VVRPGGIVVGATIVRFASLLDGLARAFYRSPDFLPIVRTDLATGEHRVPADKPQWFTTAYFHHPDELPAEVTDAGLRLVRTVAVEGPLWMIAELDAILADEASTALLLNQLRLVESEPSLFGASSHLLTLATRSAPSGGAPSPYRQGLREELDRSVRRGPQIRAQPLAKGVGTRLVQRHDVSRCRSLVAGEGVG
jgi:hypothetical protein